MKILYATDLHGQSDKFDAVKKVLGDHDLIILGADILPKGEGTTNKKIIDFIENGLDMFFNQVTTPIILDFGNDDWLMYYNLFKGIVDLHDHVYISHLNEIKIGEYTFIGMHYVPDYPFGIKDWCRIDGPKICDSTQFGAPYTSESGEIRMISGLRKWLLKKKSIFEVLDSLAKPTDKTVYLIHGPPKYSGLDVCFRSGPVGSTDIFKWITKEQPFLVLHGHIHESYEMTNTAITRIGDSICINPGQKGGYGFTNFVWCEFNLNDVEGTFIRKEIKE